MRRIVNLLLFGIVTFSLALLSMGTLLSYRQAEALINPPRFAVAPTAPDLPGLRDVSFVTSDGLTLYGWYVPPRQSPGATVLFVHGQAASRTQFSTLAALLYDEGYGALLFDLRNSGQSEGTVSTMGYAEVLDVIAAFDFLLAQPETDPDRIALYGHSMGGATAIRAMAELPAARALIVDTAYTSFPDVVADGVTTLTGLPSFPWAQITIGFAENLSGQPLRDIQPVSVVGDIAPRPILFLHGTDDRVIPVSHAEALYAAAADPKQIVIVEGGGHGDLYAVAPETVTPAVLAFLDQSIRR